MKQYRGCFWGILVFAFTAMTVSVVIAASQSDSLPDIAAQDDQNGDNKVSAEEFSGTQELFERLDQDGDGYIEASEVQQPRRTNGRGRGNRGSGRFEQDDVNGDGEVSRSEFSGPADHFDRLDLDGDGAIQESEAQQSAPQASRGNRQMQ